MNRGKKDDSQPDDKGKQADKKSEDKASSGGRFGGLAARIPGFGRKKDADASASTSSADDKKQSAFGADSSKGKTSRIGGKSSKTNTDKKDATAKTETPSLFTRISERLPFGHRLKESRSKKATSKTRAERAKKTPHLKEGEGLSLDDKLDILGVALVVTALVLFFSSLSNQQGTLTGTINTLISQIFGNGAIAVPFAMGAIGVWLIIRHFGDEAPEIDPVRIAGLVMLYIGILMVFMIIETFIDSIYTLANAETFPIIVRNHTIQNGWGGGWIGGELYILLVTMLGEIPAFFAVFGWIIVSVMLATRTTAAELAVFVISAWRSFQIAVQRRAQARRVERMKQLEARNQQQAAEVHISKPEPGSLPAGSQSALPQGEVPIEQRGILIRRGGEAQPIQNAPAASAPPPPTQLPEREAQSRGGLLSSFTSRLKNAVPFSGSKSNEQAITAQPEPELEIVKPQEKIISSPPPPTTMPTPAKEQSTTAVPANPAQPAAASVGGRSPFARPDGAESSLLKPRPFTSPAFTPKSDEDDDQETTTAPDDLLARDFPQSAERAARLDQLRSGLTRPTIDDEDDEEDDDLMDDEALAAAVQPAAFSPFNKPERDAAGTPSHSQGFTLPTSKAGTPPKPQDDSSAVPKPVEPQNRPMPKVVASAEPAPAINPGQKRTEQPAKVSATPMRGANKQWRLPDYRTLLAPGSEGDFDRNQLVQRARIIEETLKSFGAPGKVVEINTGPVITQFGVEPDYLEGRSGKKSRVKVSAIAQLDKDLQLALGAKSIRVEAPVPGKGFVGIEVPNEEASLVSLRDVMESPQFNKIAEKSMLAICLGQSVDGTPVAADLAQMPHLLVAGTTGSGKSVCVNAIIASLLIRNTPDQVKFIMVDPKRVELTGYNGIPHLVAPVVVELERIVGVLKWVTREMDERYKKFSEAGARNITDYNEHRPETTPPMPYIVVIIDELADLMMLAPDETERVITRIAALARATGIHLVIATQRPSVDVVTGLIKANFPARIAFAVAGGVDSRVILDQPGAERLLGKGDMLYMSGDSPAPQRLQGVFVSDMEINNICRYWRSQGVATEQKPITALVMDDSTESTASIIPKGDRFMASPPPSTQKAFWDETSPANPDNHSAGYGSTSVDEAGHEDELYAEAVELVRRLNKASVSLLQRRLRIGYTRAARLIDVMEAEGVVGPPTEGSKPREVLPYKK
ncbi:MAG: DUF87 domain-containing protein [Chloroflexi bacterium]|nr:MAG: DUF87 domain-containing protein [Chloroflexota bacterium]